MDGAQHFTKNMSQDYSNLEYDSSDDEYLDVSSENLDPSSSTVTRLPSTYYVSTPGPNKNSDDCAILYENYPTVPTLNVEVNSERNEIIVDILQKKCAPFRASFSTLCKDLCGCIDMGLNVQLRLGKNDSVEENNEEPVNSTQDPPPNKKAALYCRMCSMSHVEILKSGKHLVSSLCGHLFCNVCVDQCPASHKNCQTCGEKLTKQEYHPLYQ